MELKKKSALIHGCEGMKILNQNNLLSFSNILSIPHTFLLNCELNVQWKKVERYLSMLIIKYKWNYTNIYNIYKCYIQIALNSHLLTNFCATNGPTFFRVKYSKYRLVSVENFNWFFWQVRCRSRMSDKHGTRDSKISIIPIFFP